MAGLDRLKEAQRAAQMAAARRYAARAAEREKNKATVETLGPGAADSAGRRSRFATRMEAFGKARALRSAHLLPVGLERKIGATLDWVDGAPSEVSRKAGRPVARIVDNIGAGLQPEGFATGFLVATDLLMTNHHVFPTRSDAVGVGANFLYERSDRGTEAGVVFELDPDRFYVSDEALDFAIVAVKPKSLTGTTLDTLGVITLVEATPKILRGQPVNIIQYPEGGTKRYAIRQNRLVDILDREGFLHYETDTLEGSSGSPAFSEQWELVALHHAGIPEMKNGRIVAAGGGYWTDGMRDDEIHWIANEGIRVSAIVGRLSAMTLAKPEEQAILRDLLASTTDPVDDINRRTAVVANPLAPESVALAGIGPSLSIPFPPEAAMANNQFIFNGPVTIHVHAPGTAAPAPAAAPAGAVVATAPAPAAEEASIRFDPNYANRKGYDPAFLDPRGDIRVPAPTVAAERLDEMLKGRDGKPLVLKYHHFELAMNETRRLQMWSAANVDYDPARKPDGSRTSFGKDKWILDKRIPSTAQLTDPDFYKPAGQVDRGHIVRREDNAWGDSDREVEFANSDTFHWTNCTPQHAAFNRSSPGGDYGDIKGLWGDFENYIQQSRKGKDTRACILAGPVLDAKDPVADFGDGEIAYPVRFWKVVCVAEPSTGNGKRLRTFGFVLSQKPVVDKFGIEAFGAGRFKRYQVSLAKITELTGVVFADPLHAADALHGAPESLRITSGRQVVGLVDDAAPADKVEEPAI
ncbi:MAG: DNA/RNA non-specific endonuclease [Proteobacteria bacterium]|nr:DNA/RNA non-specific endonuclease [Pseudomonadota bacterium]